MAIPLGQAFKVGFYLFKQKLMKRKKYHLVLMLEPLYRCNLECIGCGKIQKPNEILKKYLSVEDCLSAAEECGAPIVSVAGGEPLIHPDIVDIVKGLVDQGRYVYLCTNALLLDRYIDQMPKTPRLTFSIHLDGMKEHHDHICAEEGVYDKAIDAIKLAKQKGFRVTTNTTFFGGVTVEEAEKFLDHLQPLDVDGMTVASAFQYPDAPTQDQFFGRRRTQEFFKELLSKNHNGRWNFSHSPFYLEFLEGKRDYDCTPWGNPSYSVLGWQKPCYLLDEGYAESFNALMEETEWEKYGHRNHDKCKDCTAHCGYEATAVEDSTNGLKNMVYSAKMVLM
jgi:hopanoid biosynthesis associated radical SAM protein HpnH